MKLWNCYANIVRAVLIAIVIGGFSGLARGQDKVSEPLIKSALVYNISKFAHWPDGALSNSPDSMLACVVGTGKFAKAFNAIQGRVISGRRVYVIRVSPSTKFTQCHILVIPSEGFDRVAGSLGRLQNHPILLFSDREGFAQRYGAVEIISTNQRVGFKVNIDRLAATGIKLSSKVLSLAAETIRETGGN